MNARMLICPLLLFALSSGCGNDPSGPPAPSEIPPANGTAFEWNVGPRTVFTPDGSASLRLPAGPNGWQLLDPSRATINDAHPNTLFLIASDPDGPRHACAPPANRAVVPARGSLIQITESNRPTSIGELRRIGYPPTPEEFEKWPAVRDPCQPARTYSFRRWNRAFQAWVWPGTDRHRILPILNSFEAQPPGAAPVRPPFMALDCRQPANTLACERVAFRVYTRVPMKRLAVRIGGEAGPTLDLRANRRRAGYPVLPGTVWRGTLRDAGLRTPGSPLFVDLPASRSRWSGTPPVRVTMEVIARRPGGPSGTWRFPRTELAAGHG